MNGKVSFILNVCHLRHSELEFYLITAHSEFDFPYILYNCWKWHHTNIFMDKDSNDFFNLKVNLTDAIFLESDENVEVTHSNSGGFMRVEQYRRARKVCPSVYMLFPEVCYIVFKVCLVPVDELIDENLTENHFSIYIKMLYYIKWSYS